MGPTAIGKTIAAITLAQHLPIEIISVDSAMVFRGMDVGTAKPDSKTLQQTPHALINIIDPTQHYSAAQFCQDALELIAKIRQRGRLPLLVGGTMLYFNALQYGLHCLPGANPALREALTQEAEQIGWPAMHAKLAIIDAKTAAKLEVSDAQRIQRALEVYALTGQPLSQFIAQHQRPTFPYPLLKIALMAPERALLHTRIKHRLEQMLKYGLVEEVQSLQQRYPDLSSNFPSMRCVGYRQTWAYLAGQYNFDALQDKIAVATRQLAKRQLTWLRTMRDCKIIDGLDCNYIIKIQQWITSCL